MFFRRKKYLVLLVVSDNDSRYFYVIYLLGVGSTCHTYTYMIRRHTHICSVYRTYDLILFMDGENEAEWLSNLPATSTASKQRSQASNPGRRAGTFICSAYRTDGTGIRNNAPSISRENVSVSKTNKFQIPAVQSSACS
uniref:Uncharacterized protein n=1 Tax=Rousettus aegyptiacus TaxID=9407 RepID=A0A7J8INB2_ROUAE|nr:hypothetical protein HJG63_010770 [Rousettus aegyptiacus]